MTILLFVAMAFADDPPTVPVAPGTSARATVQSYLVPEPRWKACIDLARDKPICDEALDGCQRTADEALADAKTNLTMCQVRLGEYADSVTSLSLQHEADLVVVKKLRSQRNVAYGTVVAITIVMASTAIITL